MGCHRTFQRISAIPAFMVKTDNNSLTYIMTTPNLDATGHQWVSALAKYNFLLEYQKGWDNAVADALSQVIIHPELETVQAILDGATVGTSQGVEREDPAIIKGDQQLEQVQSLLDESYWKCMSPIGQQLKKRMLSWMQFCNG